MSAEEPMPDQVVAPHEPQDDQQLPDIPPAEDATAPVENDDSMAIDNNETILTENNDPTPIKTDDPVTPARKKGTEIPPEHRGAIYQRYLNGESMGNIAKSEKLSKSTIQHVVRKVKETGSTQTKPRCGRPLKQGELSRTTLRRRKLKGLLVESGDGTPTDSPTQLALDRNDALNPIDPVVPVPYPITATMTAATATMTPTPAAVAGASRRTGASNEFDFVQTPVSTTVVCTDIYGINHAVPTSELQWRPSAYAVVIKNNSILLLRQNGGAYDLPGGGVKLGEHPEQAVLREVKEETGINATTPTLLGVESSFFRASHSDNSSSHSILMYYSCAHSGGKISTRGLDAHEKQYVETAEWVKLSALDGIKVSSTVDFRPYIRKANAPKPQ